MDSREVLERFIIKKSCAGISCIHCPFDSLTSGCAEENALNLLDFTEQTYSKILNIYIKDYGEVELYKLLMERG